MSLCLSVGGKAVVLALTSFTLAWTHSVEKTAWEEDWRLAAEGLVIQEARIKGSGAGMDPPEGARFDGTWWRYRPNLPAVPELILANGGTVEDWRLCDGMTCRPLARLAGAPPGSAIKVSRCPAP